jgi:hypothetical protein
VYRVDEGAQRNSSLGAWMNYIMPPHWFNLAKLSIKYRLIKIEVIRAVVGEI